MIPERYAPMAYALFRIVFGLIFFMFGMQKLAGWFGGQAAPIMSMWPMTTTTTQSTRTRSITGSRAVRPGMGVAERDALDSLTAPPTRLGWPAASVARPRRDDADDMADDGVATRGDAPGRRRGIRDSQGAQGWRP